MRVYNLLSRLDPQRVVKVILNAYGAFIIRFVSNEASTPFETTFKIEGLIRLNGNDINGLLGRGSDDFANQWFFIPGTSDVAYNLSAIVVSVPFRAQQPFGQLKLELEAAVIKALEPSTPA